MKLAVIYLGQYAFPYMVTVHDNDTETNLAVSAHAKAHGLTIHGRSSFGADGRYQLWTNAGKESMNSYLILPVGSEDPEHAFGG